LTALAHKVITNRRKSPNVERHQGCNSTLNASSPQEISQTLVQLCAEHSYDPTDEEETRHVWPLSSHPITTYLCWPDDELRSWDVRSKMLMASEG
jgi:hypothetical protein